MSKCCECNVILPPQNPSYKTCRACYIKSLPRCFHCNKHFSSPNPKHTSCQDCYFKWQKENCNKCTICGKYFDNYGIADRTKCLKCRDLYVKKCEWCDRQFNGMSHEIYCKQHDTVFIQFSGKKYRYVSPYYVDDDDSDEVVESNISIEYNPKKYPHLIYIIELRKKLNIKTSIQDLITQIYNVKFLHDPANGFDCNPFMNELHEQYKNIPHGMILMAMDEDTNGFRVFDDDKSTTFFSFNSIKACGRTENSNCELNDTVCSHISLELKDKFNGIPEIFAISLRALLVVFRRRNINMPRDLKIMIAQIMIRSVQ